MKRQEPKSRTALASSVWPVAALTIASSLPVRSFAQEHSADRSTAQQQSSGYMLYDNSELKSQANWFERFRDCKVLDLSENDGGVVFNITGRVVDSDSAPVKDAIVVLREWSTYRSSSDPKLLEGHRERLRVNDVFAKTATDEDGNFVFANSVSPAIPKVWKSSWSWDIIATSPGGEVAWEHIINREQLRIEKRFDLVLKKTTSLSGKLEAPNGTPIAGAVVALSMLGDTVNSLFNPVARLDLQMSQLTPRAISDNDGNFEFKGIPVGPIATVHMTHPDWAWGAALVATTSASPVDIGSRTNPFPRSMREIKRNPFTIVADPGVYLRGRVIDENERAVQSVKISFSSSVDAVETAEDGAFELRIPSSHLEQLNAPGREAQLARFVVRCGDETGLLSRYIELPEKAIRDGDPVTIKVERGAHVSGYIFDERGKPVRGISVIAVRDPKRIPTSDVSDKDGYYELLLPAGSSTLVLGTDDPGFALPSRRDISMATRESVQGWLHLNVNVGKNEKRKLPDFVVSKSPEVEILVQNADGAPVGNVSVVVKDKVERFVEETNYSFPPEIREVSAVTMTNKQGRVRLPLQGVPSDRAYVEARATIDGSAFDGISDLSKQKDGLLTITLHSGWIVRGKVTLNGEPLNGVRVSVGQREPVSRPDGRTSFGGFRVSNMVFCVTNDEGEYEIAVPEGSQYSVSILNVPGDSQPIGIGFSPDAPVNRVLAVREFALLKGDGQIAGRVVGSDGKPVSGARVDVERSVSTNPMLWVGHRAASQNVTDSNGRFHLRNVPEGSYELRVMGERNAQGRYTMSRVPASTGSLLVRIPLETEAPPVVPRLEVVEITDID